MKPTMPHKPPPMLSILDKLSQTRDRLHELLGERGRTALVSEAICHSAACLQAPTSDTAAEPHHAAVDDCRGNPFEPGIRIPCRQGSALDRVSKIFTHFSDCIWRRRFNELGAVRSDLGRLVAAGGLAKLEL